MSFFVVGTNHRFSSLEVREKFSFSRKKLREAFRSLKKTTGIDSFLILSTCNRSEIYLWSDQDMDLRRIFCGLHEISEEVFAPFLYQHEGAEALRHLLRVMSGLDSQILGEPQIFLQVRQAVRCAEESRALNLQAAYLISRSVVVAEKIRREMGEGSFSRTLADAAFELIQRNYPLFRNMKFLLVGTGKVMELFIPLLARECVRPVIVSNRNHEKAEEWAQMLGGEAGRLEDLLAWVSHAEIIISATSCPKTVLHQEHFRGHPKTALVLDLAVPRDADVSIKEIPGVKLFDLDDLGLSAVKNGSSDWAHAAERIVCQECGELWKELSGLGQEKVLSR